jgi:hypothetical protein
MTENTPVEKPDKQAGIRTKVFLAATIFAAVGGGLFFLGGDPDAGPADCPSVGDKCSDGTVYVGSRELKDGDGAALGDFYLFAAPEDLKDDQGNRLLLTFNEAVDHVADLRDFHGHAGGRFESGVALQEAIDSGLYDGEWFIPPEYILLNNLYRNKDEGALRGTFTTELGRSAFAPWYWSCTEPLDNPSTVHIVNFTDGDVDWNHKDNYELSVRPVRAEPRP